MKVLLINNKTKRIKQTEDMLKDFEITTLDVEDISEKDSKNYDLIVLSGGKIATAFSQKKIIKYELGLIKSSNIPIFGICLGIQLIVRAYSPVRYKRLTKRRRGIMKIKYNDHDLNVFNSHNWSVSYVKSPLISVASSSDGIEIIKHETKPIWGVQFHPEADEEFGTNGKIVFDDFIKSYF